MAWAFEQDVGSSAAKFLLVALADHADGTSGVCFPSLDRLAVKTNQDRKTIISNLDLLCSLGLLRETGTTKGNGIKEYQIIGIPHDRSTHYVYRVTHAASGEFYIGVRSCDGHPESDDYFGSGSWPMKQGKSDLIRSIIGIYHTREEAELSERFHLSVNSGNPKIKNKAFPKTGRVPETEPVPKTEQHQYQKRNHTSTGIGTAPVPKTEPITTTKQQEPPTNQNTPAFSLPDWVPVDVWEEFMATRKKLKAKDTDYAKKLLVNQLSKFKDQGHDPVEIINTSIRSGWKDVYAPRVSASQATKRTGFHHDLSKMDYTKGVDDHGNF